MNNPKQILGTDINSAPPKNYLGQKEDGIYTLINGYGQRTKAFKSAKELTCEEQSSNVAKLTNGEYLTIDEIPEGVIGQNYGGIIIPDDLCLDKCEAIFIDKEKEKKMFYNAILIEKESDQQ